MINKNRARCKARIYACGDRVRLQNIVAVVDEARREDFSHRGRLSKHSKTQHMAV